jgi:hypothetical protein
MATERELRLGLTVGLVAAIALYHLSGYFLPTTTPLQDFYRIVQIAVAIAVYFLVIFNKLFARLVFREHFIAGKYEGRSLPYKEVKESPTSLDEINIEYFSISQNLFDTGISGRSIQESNGQLISIWHGKLFKVERNTFYFGLELSYERAGMGILQLSFDNGDAQGFYFSGDYKTGKTFIFTAKKVNNNSESKVK